MGGLPVKGSVGSHTPHAATVRPSDGRALLNRSSGVSGTRRGRPRRQSQQHLVSLLPACPVTSSRGRCCEHPQFPQEKTPIWRHRARGPGRFQPGLAPRGSQACECPAAPAAATQRPSDRAASVHVAASLRMKHESIPPSTGGRLLFGFWLQRATL